MKRSTIIATCLVNSNMAKSLDEGEAIVRSVFAEFSPYTDFAKWNENVHDSAASIIIKSVDTTATIQVDRFIKDLSEGH